jgi:hypothetical protein
VTHRLFTLALAVLLATATPVSAQRKAPSLSKEQRQSLLAAVTAAAAAAPLAAGGFWQTHLLRASDGSHYVAFSLEAPADLTPEDRLALYVRLEPRRPADQPISTTMAPRSAVEDWLRGERSDPLPMRAARVVTVPSGELPMGGPSATQTRDGSGQNSAVLALIERQQRKAREEQEAREKARREAMEGRAAQPQNLMPFEDFDLAAHVVPRADRMVFERAVTAGPGSYDVIVSWAVLDGKNRSRGTGAVRQPLTLPATHPGLGLGSIILADAIRPRANIQASTEQTAHPYAIGGTEIEPASDHDFTNDERLSVAFQVLNAAPTAVGKPDVGITFRLFRRTASGEEPSAGLAPLEYSERTLPADFDLALGHPLLAAFAAPLRTLPRGEYRLAIAATDRVTRTTTTADTRFRIVATPAALLADAPPFSAPFVRTRMLQPAVYEPALDALAPFATTPGLTPLLSLARQHRFVDLIPDRSVDAGDRGMALLLQAMASYALGDTPRALVVRLTRAVEAGAPAAAAGFWMGAALALDGRDADAVEAWRAARAAGWPAALVSAPIAEAMVRLGTLEEAGAVASEALNAGAVDGGLVRVASAADIAARRYPQAADRLSRHLAFASDDQEARWLLLHALFSEWLAEDTGAGIRSANRSLFAEHVQLYLDGAGRHRALAEEWRDLITSSASAAP